MHSVHAAHMWQRPRGAVSRVHVPSAPGCSHRPRRVHRAARDACSGVQTSCCQGCRDSGLCANGPPAPPRPLTCWCRAPPGACSPGAARRTAQSGRPADASRPACRPGAPATPAAVLGRGARCSPVRCVRSACPGPPLPETTRCAAGVRATGRMPGSKQARKKRLFSCRMHGFRATGQDPAAKSLPAQDLCSPAQLPGPCPSLPIILVINGRPQHGLQSTPLSPLLATPDQGVQRPKPCLQRLGPQHSAQYNVPPAQCWQGASRAVADGTPVGSCQHPARRNQGTPEGGDECNGAKSK